MRSLTRNSINPIRPYSGLLLLSLLLPWGIQAQKMTLARQASAAIISQNNSYDILEDRYGFIWYGGGGGLRKFDGYESHTYRKAFADTSETGIGVVHSLLEDKKGRIWIGSDAGLFRYERESDHIVQFFPGQLKDKRGNTNTIFSLHEDRNARLWLGGKDKLYLVSGAEMDNLQVFDLDVGIDYGRLEGINCIREDRQGRLFAATLNGLWEIGADFSFTRHAPASEILSKKTFMVYDAEMGKGDSLWLATSHGLFAFESSHKRFHFIKTPSDGRLMMLELLLDEHGHLFFANDDGLWERSPEGRFQNIAGRELPTLFALKILEKDRFGNLWVGGFDGLGRLSLQEDRTFPFYQISGSLPNADNGFFRISRDSAGGLWFRMLRSGLGYCPRLGPEGSFEIVMQPPREQAVEEVKSICTDADGNVWALTLTKGIFCFPKGSKQGRAIDLGDSLKTAFATTLLADRWDRRLIWFTSQYGLCSVDRFSFQRRWFRPKEDLPWLDRNGTGNFEQDDEGNIWCTTLAKGKRVFIRFNRKTERFDAVPMPPELPPGTLGNQMKSGEAGTMWMPTNRGVLMHYVTTSQQIHIVPKNGSISYATSLTPDNTGSIWLASGTKIYKCDGKEFERFNAPEEIGNFLNYAAGLTKEGLVIFGGTKGMVVFDPLKIRRDSTLPKVYLTGFRVNGKEYPLGTACELVREIALTYDQKAFSFDFAAPHFFRPDLIKYKYRLEGYDDDWNEASSTERRAHYANLSPGSYTFKVLAANPDGFWTSEAEGLNIRLVVLPPWYRTWWAYLLYAMTIIGILLAIRRFELRRHLAAAEARRLRELDSVKTKLYTNITHEFRTPLTVILGETAQLEKQAGKNQKSGLDAIRRQGRQLLNLVNQMLDLAKVEAGSLHLNMAQGNVVLFLKYLLESFHSLADSKQIELLFETDAEEFWMDYDPDKLQKIASNLLSNAIKFTPENGRVKMKLEIRNLKLLTSLNSPISNFQFLISISDTGQGIPPEKLPFVFDRFYQADDSATRQAEGTGIGLTLTKELVQLLGGQISVESRLGEGSTFIVTLPVTRAAEKQQPQPGDIFTENQEMKPELEASAVPNFQLPISNFKQNRPLLLLIEDNADVIRYLSSLLAADYQIHQAGNGREGLEVAFRLVPDLIISDVMMPEMDGFELCRALKTDVRSSHIPVILLTAKADLDSRIEGLEHGADAYLAKPFEERELKVQLRKLHELRQALRERYGQPGQLTPSDLPAFRREDVFFQKLHSVLAENYSEAAFGVPEFCSAMTMSRPNLFRKLTALTGKNIEDYLRSFRLHKAQELLRSTDLNVQEVAWDCGFNDAAYFTRAFHAEFGINPSQVR